MSVNHEVKGTLAKLLATENLIIEHKKVPTACFDVLRRVLTLPIWDRASSVVYDLLVGHEVGHAIYTPNEDWTTKVPVDVPKDYVNVVEDARIEKLMKRKFPGLARTFYTGYSELNRDDFFGIADEDLNELSLIDRINLHFKIGAYAQMPFDQFEQQFVEMIEAAETFDQVLTICELIHKYVKENQKESACLPTSENTQSGGGNSQGASGESEDSMEMNGDGSQSDRQGSSGDGEENQTSEDQQGLAGSVGSGPNENEKVDENVSKTQQAFDKQSQQLTNQFTTETYYIERPKLNMDHVIADYGMLLKYLDNFFQDSNQYGMSSMEKVDKDYHLYRNEAQKEVNYLVKEFEMKKSADAYQRMSTARTGTLDTTKLHTYKYNEDIFRKVSVIPDGKNHGLVFILDWSGSMTDYLLDTVKQLMNLVWFCKKVQIPFEVYAFTYEWSNSLAVSNYVAPKDLYTKKDGTIEVHKRFRLLNFLSSRANNKVLDRCIMNLWRLACREDSKYYGAQYRCPAGLDLSGTPLNESIIALHDIIPQFKNQNKLQKVNVVILTDGDGNHLNYDVKLQHHRTNYDYMGTNYINGANALRDRKIGYVYRNFELGNVTNNLTSILLENLKDNFPEVNLIGFRIMGGNGFSHLYRDFYKCAGGVDPETAIKVWRKEKSYEINGMGYDALYAISSHDLSSNAIMTVDGEASTADIGKAFRTMLMKKTTNKKLLTSFATLVS
jgi:hypothetical protein